MKPPDIITATWLEAQGFRRLTPYQFQTVIPAHIEGLGGVELRVLNTGTRWAVSVASDGMRNTIGRLEVPDDPTKQWYEPTYITGREFRRPDDLMPLMLALGWKPPGPAQPSTDNPVSPDPSTTSRKAIPCS